MVDGDTIVCNGAEYSATADDGWTHSFSNRQAAQAYVRALKAGRSKRAQLARIAAQAHKEPQET